MHKTHSASIDL